MANLKRYAAHPPTPEEDAVAMARAEAELKEAWGRSYDEAMQLVTDEVALYPTLKALIVNARLHWDVFFMCELNDMIQKKTSERVGAEAHKQRGHARA